MVRLGKNLPLEQQLCLAHAVHLAVMDTFYRKKKDEEQLDIPDYEGDDEEQERKEGDQSRRR